MHPVEVVGSINVDLVTTTPRVPGPGETLKASSFHVGNGGKGANQAVACARLLKGSKASVRMVGAVGQDQFGHDSLKQLQAEHIDCDNVKLFHGQKTGITVIIVEEASGENRILFTPGANDAVDFEHVELDHNVEENIVLFQLELPLQTVTQGLKKAKAMRKVTMLNPAPATPLPDDCYSSIDHLIVNESEAATLSGVREEDLTGSLDRVADVFMTKGVKYVVITLGASGVYWKSAADRHQRGDTIQAHRVKAVDTTAAGDTFVGAYAAFLTECGEAQPDTDTLRSAVHFANQVASLSVQKSGAQASIPYRSELDSDPA